MTSCLLIANFDFINWFYWTLWWQQCSYVPTLATPFSMSPFSRNSSISSEQSRQPFSQQTNSISIGRGIGIQIRIINGKCYYDVHVNITKVILYLNETAVVRTLIWYIIMLMKFAISVTNCQCHIFLQNQ